MSRKRRQRSTTIRKRIEKKAREAEKQRRKASKAAGGRGADVKVRLILGRRVAQDCSVALADLGSRLAAESIRGWTPHDLAGEHGLSWLGGVLGEAAQGPGSDRLEIDIDDSAKSHLLDKLGGLEMAAPGLKVAWEEAGFDHLFQALGQAEEVPPDLDEDEDEDDESVSESEDEA